MRPVLLLVCIVLAIGSTTAQEPALTPIDTQIKTQLNIFEVEEQVVIGKLQNDSDEAYTAIEIYVDVLDEDGETIGEGFGYVVDECGAALLDFAMQPGKAQNFSVVLDLFDTDVEIDDFNIVAEGTSTEPEAVDFSQVFNGVSVVTFDEVVSVGWLDDMTIRYGVGCAGEIFTELDWFEVSLDTFNTTALEAHPRAENITEAFLIQSGLNRLSQGNVEDPFIYERSYLTFTPNTRRIVYQNDLNTVLSTESDGSFKRLVHDKLHQYSLQGFNFVHDSGVFAAYYFGAYGEPVRYFTASIDDGLLSQLLPSNTPSSTIPTPLPDGRKVIIGGTFDDVTGYYLEGVFFEERELLMEYTVPGNNYPAPIYYPKSPEEIFIYFVHPVDGEATLQCYDRMNQELHTLTRLPITLQTDEQAWTWLSPDKSQIALAANGDNSGLWLIDLSVFGVCQ